MEIEITRASGDEVEFARPSERSGQFVEVDSWNELHDILDENYIIHQSEYNFGDGFTGSTFEGIDYRVTIYDGYVE